MDYDQTTALIAATSVYWLQKRCVDSSLRLLAYRQFVYAKNRLNFYPYSVPYFRHFEIFLWPRFYGSIIRTNDRLNTLK